MIVKVPVDTQCRPFIKRPERAYEVLNELVSDFIEIGNMMPYQVAQLLGRLSARFERIERGDEQLHNDVNNKEDTNGKEEEQQGAGPDDGSGIEGQGQDQGAGGTSV